jgi:hypothetical protein
VGNACLPGIVDHHSAATPGGSTSALVVERFDELIGSHLQDIDSRLIEFRMHALPDLDCVLSYYSAVELLGETPRRTSLQKLSTYADAVDQGRFPDADQYTDSMYGIFVAHTTHSVSTGKKQRDQRLLESGLRVVDAAMLILDEEGSSTTIDGIFRFHPEWFAAERKTLSEDYERYQMDKKDGLIYHARVNGINRTAKGLWLNRPRSMLFKMWARADKETTCGEPFGFLVVDWSNETKNRFVISVDPESGTDLLGLGKVLEYAETSARETLNRPRPKEPRRYPSDNADPWYDGSGHNYTIIDSPTGGTVLTPHQVRELHQDWNP